MRKVEFPDTTLHDGEQTPGIDFSIKEKVAIAKQLEGWGIASVEAGFPAAGPDSSKAARQIPVAMTTTAVSGLARSVKSDINICYEALKDARCPQCHVFIAAGPIHREYKLKKTKEEILDIIKGYVTYARSKFDVTGFSPEDAIHTESDYLLQVVQTVVGADTAYVGIPDTIGFTTPEEYGSIFKYLIENTESDREIIFSPHCRDDLGMVTVNTLVAIKNGVGYVERAVNGTGEHVGNVTLGEITVILNTREGYYQATSDTVLNETVGASELTSRLSGISIPESRVIVGENAFSHESGIHQNGVLKSPLTYEIIAPELVGIKHNSLPLGKLSDRHAFVEKLKELKLAFEESEIATLFGKFKKLVDKKHKITSTGIRALAAGTEIENPEGFHFDDLRLTLSTDDTVIAEVLTVSADDEEIEVIVDGKGSVEVIYNAVDKFFNQAVRLLGYTMGAVTDGIDSQVRVSVPTENVDTGTIFNASGIDFDVLKTGAIAYINANTFVQKENTDEIDKAVSSRDAPTN